MTNSYSNNSYKYAGRKYAFIAEIFTRDPDGNKQGTFLNNDDIIMFEYENMFNQLYLTGQLIIIDKYGIIDKYLDEPLTFCRISHTQYEMSNDGDITTDTLSEDRKFQEDFFILNIKIIERSGHQLTYQLTLVSSEWLNLTNSIVFSNYQFKPQSIFTIIKSLLIDVGLKINEDTFSKITTDVKINYATQQNDNVITSVKYLLNKLYYYSIKDNSLKFILYNETTKKYQLYDVRDTEMTNGTSILIMSMFKNQAEQQSQSQLIELRSIVKTSKEKTFKSTFDQQLFDYSLDTNKFIDQSIKSDTFINFKNEMMTNVEEEYVTRFKKLKTDMKFQNSGTMWNNKLSFYDDCQSAAKEDNTLVVGVDPEILRKPGSIIAIDVDRDDLSIADSEDVQKLNDTKNKYKSFEGTWIVTKTRHIISPQKPLYRQNLVLWRNFIRK